jgi:hypothetical protein
MPEGIAGDQSPPGDRIGPSFMEIHAFVEELVRAGTRALKLVIVAPWLLRLSVVGERACSRKRTDEFSAVIETMDLEIVACELLADVARAALPTYPDEGPRLIGDGYREAPLQRRYEGAALAREHWSGKAWRQGHLSSATDAIARTLYRLIYFPDTVASVVPPEVS